MSSAQTLFIGGTWQAWSGLLPADYTASAGTSVGSGLLMASMLVS